MNNPMMWGEFAHIGWIPPEERDYGTQKDAEKRLDRASRFSQAGAALRGSGEGQVTMLNQALESILGEFPVNAQEIGDCVGHGFAKGVEVLKAVEIVLGGEAEEWREKIAVEWIYGASRVLQGGGRINGDGSLGVWAADAVMENGTLLMAKYGDHDLSSYSGSRSRRWGTTQGLPRSLEETADLHPVGKAALVRSYEQARDSIANGYPVVVCSDQGFNEVRDSQGFMKPRGIWYHCMLFVAQDEDDLPDRPGLLCVNSWGRHWGSGPKRLGQPDGSFWVDADVADRMLAQGDSFSLSLFQGYPARELDFRLW